MIAYAPSRVQWTRISVQTLALPQQAAAARAATSTLLLSLFNQPEAVEHFYLLPSDWGRDSKVVMIH